MGGNKVKVRALSIQLATTDGDYGFECQFNAGLNIIRGNNTTGKSTLIKSLFYCLGMEELLGGRNEATLPYALKDYLEDDGEKIKIIESRALLEVENKAGDIRTFRRAIKSTEKNSKLIEIISGPFLTAQGKKFTIQPTYVHDGGSAQDVDNGFFRYLENFLGTDLPYVPSNSGGEVKLFIQTVFSALLIEQKRGWTDYIATTPYFAIPNVKVKIIQFLLGLDVFENEREKNRLAAELSDINKAWDSETFKIKMIEEGEGLSLEGVGKKVTSDFNANLVNIKKITNKNTIELNEYLVEIINKADALNARINGEIDDAPADVVNKFELAQLELARLTSIYDSIVSETQRNKVNLSDYQLTLESIVGDLKKNKVAKKLRDMGANKDVDLARDQCPACHQAMDDSLLLADTGIQPMSVEQNILYLESQSKMMKKYVSGVEALISKQTNQLQELKTQTSNQRDIVVAAKRDISSTSKVSEADIRTKINLDDQVASLTRASDKLDDFIAELGKISEHFKDVIQKKSKLSDNGLSREDVKKIHFFESRFRENAGRFGYKSADVSGIEVKPDTLLPYLSGLELREINPDKKISSNVKTSSDIRTDSSASDFVRLIWSYMLTTYQTSNAYSGNHFGMIILDEPGQHSMALTSLNTLLKEVAGIQQLQSIIAASFEESDEAFEESTKDVGYNLINVGGRLLQRIG